MKAKKLKSGLWSVRVFVGRDENGKTKQRTVTGETKTEALRKAALCYAPSDSMTVGEACERFLSVRGPELSPATLRGYKGTFRTYIQGRKLFFMRLSDVNTPMLQAWVSEMPKTMTSKTKKNHLGFITAVVRYFNQDKAFKVKIARQIEEAKHTPTIDEVNTLIAVADDELKKVIMLAVFGMRRGEVCALSSDDIDRERGIVRINKDIVKDDSGEWIVKTTKTRKSARLVIVPQSVIAALPKEGRIVTISPDQVSNRFVRARKKAGLPHFRLHDLRSFFVSVALNQVKASDQTVQDLGGWESNFVIQKHYKRSMSDQLQSEAQAIVDYIATRVDFGVKNTTKQSQNKP